MMSTLFFVLSLSAKFVCFFSNSVYFKVASIHGKPWSNRGLVFQYRKCQASSNYICISRIRDDVLLFEGANEDKVGLVRNVIDKVKNVIERAQMHCRPDPAVVNIVSRFLSVFIMFYRKPQYLKIFATNSNIYIYTHTYIYIHIHTYIYVCVCMCGFLMRIGVEGPLC
jgi:hypothetical protein